MKTALQFSGGKDSLALLMKMRALWDHLTVIHVDTGDLPEEAVRQVANVAASVPHFKTIYTDSKGFRKANGDPNGNTWARCCNANIWHPMNEAIRELGFRQVMRGAKACDPHIHAVFPGDVVDGLLFTFPIWNWSDKDVEEYLGKYLLIGYRKGAEGMPDCVSCTAEEACGMRTRHLWRDAA